jgi:hypothetical protein
VIRRAAAALVLPVACQVVLADLISYDFPDEMPLSPVYAASVAGRPVPALQTRRGAFLSFGMTGPVDVVVKLPAPASSVVIRPLASGIRAAIAGDTVRFTLPRPANLSLEINGDLADPLLVFANPEIPGPPDRDDPKVKFFAGGKVHDAGEIALGDGETLYLEGGAVVRGTVRARGRGIRIGGPGMLDGGTRNWKTNMLVLRECRDAVLEHFILLDPLGWSIHLSGSENVSVANTRVIGWRANSDGLDIEYSSRIRVDGCFWRTNDDCIAIKAIYPPGLEGVPLSEMTDPEKLGGHKVERRPGDTMGDIDIRNCVLWNDQGGQGFEIGFELRIDNIRNIAFRDSDIIHVVGGGAFTIHNGDRARIENLLIENIRVENAERLIDFHVGLSIYSDDCPPPYRRSNPARQPVPAGHRPARANNPYQWFVPAAADLPRHEQNRGLVENVVIRNVNVHSVPPKGSMLIGFSPARGIRNLLFQGLVIAGRPVASAADFDLYLSEAHDIRFTTGKKP